MKKDNFLFNIFKLILFDFIGGILYFPFWWYSQGFFSLIIFFFNKIKNQFNSLGILIAFKFLFKPMYAQKDFSGRIISFFMRLVVLFFKTITFLLFFVLLIIGTLFYLVLPIFVFWQVYINFQYLKII